jgi:hypothetical protein
MLLRFLRLLLAAGRNLVASYRSSHNTTFDDGPAVAEIGER